MIRTLLAIAIASSLLACSGANRCGENKQEPKNGITSGDDWEVPVAAAPSDDPCKPVQPEQGSIDPKDVYLHMPRGSNN